MKDYKIEKNIPISGRGSDGKLGFIINLDWGDSFLVDTDQERRQFDAVARKRIPEVKIVSRTQPGGKIRIWKTKRKLKVEINSTQ